MAAQGFVFVIQLDVVSPFCGDPGGFRPCRPSPDDNDPFFLSHGIDGHFMFAAEFRVHQALHSALFENGVDAGVAGDASPDLFESPFAGLVGEVRIREKGSPHAHQVGLSLLQDLIGQLWTVDPPDADDRDAYGLFDCISGIHKAAPFHEHRLGDPFRSGVVSRGDLHRVDAFLFQDLHDPDAFFDRQSPRRELLSADLDGNRNVVTDPGPHLMDDFHSEPGSFLGVASVSVGPDIRVPRKKLADQVAVRPMNLNELVSGENGPFGGVSEQRNDPLNAFFIEDFHVSFDGRALQIGRSQREPTDDLGRGLPSRVVNLNACDRPGILDRRCNFRKAFNEAVVVYPHLVCRYDSLGRHGGSLHHDHPRAAFGPSSIVRQGPVRDRSVALDQKNSHRRQDDTILQMNVSDLIRRKKVRQHRKPPSIGFTTIRPTNRPYYTRYYCDKVLFIIPHRTMHSQFCLVAR